MNEETLKAEIAEIANDLIAKGSRDLLVREIAQYELDLEGAVSPGGREGCLKALRDVAAADANPFPTPTIGLHLSALELVSAGVTDSKLLLDTARRINVQVRGNWPTTHPGTLG